MRDLSTIANVDPATPNLIYGEMVNFVADTVDGTAMTKEWVQDLYYALIAVMNEAGVIPNNTEEGATSSQFLTALQAIISNSLSILNKKEIDNADETILDTDRYILYTFDNLTANHNLNLPTLADNEGKTFYVVNLDGSYNVVITPEGAELINDWNETFEITEKYGVLKITALSDRWLVTPLNDACIYEVSTETADTGLTLDGTWDDVISLTPPIGLGYLSTKGTQLGRDTSNPAIIELYFGLGKTSGNNAPNINGGDDNVAQTKISANNNESLIMPRKIIPFEYVSDGTTIYMKAKIISDESPANYHYMYGATHSPMYIKWRRTY